MATFEDNAVVTAEDLNNIAVDLGDTTFSEFSDEMFGVDKLNQITADLVGKGILATGDRCEPIISGDKVYIKSGVIVFGSGAKIRIAEPVEVGAAAGDYIYAYNDVLTGKASIIASAEEPDAEDDKVVKLAQIDDTGVVVDLRVLSVANIALSAELKNNYAEQTVTLIDTSESGPTENIVVPALPSCEVLILKSGFVETDFRYYVYFGVELSEDYQYIFKDNYNGNASLRVKKVDGLLYFDYYSSYGGSADIKFLLA